MSRNLLQTVRVLGVAGLALLGCGSDTVSALAPYVGGAGSYYVSPSGSDSGTGSLTEPWRTLRHAISQLRPGDTLYLRGGTYYEREIPVKVAGTVDQPITIRAYENEAPVVDGGFKDFRSANNSDWELVDSGKQLYRSVKTFASLRRVSGYFGPANGGFRLVPYEDAGPLSTTNQDYEDAWPYYYIGPGVLWDESDGRIYVRLVKSKYQDLMGYDLPSTTDPRRVPLHLFDDGHCLDLEASAAHLAIEGITFRYAGTVLHFGKGSHHISVRDCTLLGGRYHVLIRDAAHDLLFERVTVPDKMPPWVARSDVKRPSTGRPGHQFQGAAFFLDGAVDRVTIRHSEFHGLFDAVDATDTPSNLKIHDNRFTEIRDEVMQLSSAGFQIEFYNNVVRRAAAGVSWHGNGSAPPSLAGTKYIHHNIIDTSTLQLYARSDPKGLLPSKWKGENGDGMATGRPFGTHYTSQITEPDPWKIYHNTLVFGADVDNRGGGQCYPLTPSDPDRPHEVFNNVIVQKVAHYAARGARVGDGTQIMDGNLYYREVETSKPLFLEFKYGSSKKSFASLAEFKASSYWSATRNSYAPGWEASGVEADPQLDSSYRPSSAGPAASGAVDLADKGWPGERSLFRGAVSPGKTGTVNKPPIVDAGPAEISVVESATLAGTASDDGLPVPPGKITLTWRAVTGPGTVAFSDPAAAHTTATFSTPGTYLLELRAYDGELASTDTITVTVEPAPNQAPVVEAGEDQRLTSLATTLQGRIQDDGLPSSPGRVQALWTVAESPKKSEVRFADPSSPTTSVMFSTSGRYVLRLTGDDGELKASDHVTIRIRAGKRRK